MAGYKYTVCSLEDGYIFLQFNDLDILEKINITISYFVIDNINHKTIITKKL